LLCPTSLHRVRETNVKPEKILRQKIAGWKDSGYFCGRGVQLSRKREFKDSNVCRFETISVETGSVLHSFFKRKMRNEFDHLLHDVMSAAHAWNGFILLAIF
jgi:hypothetical protein